MRRSELAERDVAADRLRIFFVTVGRLEGGAGRVRFSSARQRVLDHLSGGAHHHDLETGDRDLVTRLCNGVRRLPVKPRIGVFQKIVDRLVWLSIRTVIDVVPYGNASGELRNTARMIAVPVGDDQMIDLSQVRVACRGDDASGVAYRSGATVARIDQQRLARRRDKQCRVAAFDVHDVDVERLRGSRLCQRRRSGQCNDRQESEEAAHSLTPL